LQAFFYKRGDLEIRGDLGDCYSELVSKSKNFIDPETSSG